MKQFKDFGIKSSAKSLQGEKISIKKVLNKEVSVHDYIIAPSKYPDKGNGKCLHLQINVGGEMRVLFSGSGYLMNAIEQVPRESFPFSATIEEINERFEFR